ncbi:ras GTPase-activating protein 1-like isoform X2 [Babylonia areolata]|uniref:ras GTPase-activating protein 1-like isoform X2 n=1 Tax=Babylonia areolata TaxID=304850 RepID=UPI003FD31519
MAADGGQAEGGDDFDPRTCCELDSFTDKHINSALTAPDQKLWYHGRLGRTAAEELLRDQEVGSYLVRESESKLGSFVLSYLGHNFKITHFRILAMCGDYYIGGRQFESLSDLIGYYTSCSCLLKNEHLMFPVAPQEPVDDRRRVVAMLSYRKAADSDELSFGKGDVFVVQNEMEDGWLWVTSERTKESGLVPAPFVKDLDGDYEPVENLPYYHSCLSKEEAVEKLMQAGEGSFLVRQSENYPGDYSLFFLCEKDVRRFRIERRGNQFLVGGRYFDSLDGVIKRYMKEEIVEGHTLVNAVYRDVFDSNNTRFERLRVEGGSQDIYAPIRQSTGPKLVTRTNDRIEMSGYLHFRNEKMKKFKPYYFVLNGTENMLYFFENEKRSKPKGLVELNYTSIYPIHDSLFGRPNCFLLVSTYDNQNKTLSYINAESSEVIRRWVHILKDSCTNTSGAVPKKGLRSLHSLSVTVFSAHNVPYKLLSHPACALALNQHRVARTQTCESGDPFWGEEFQLDDIPSDVESFTVSLINVKRSREMFIGSVTVHLSSLENQDSVDEHYPMVAVGGALSKGEVGSLRFRTHYRHQVLLPQAEYTSLKELLIEEGYENLLTLAQLCPKQEWSTLARALLRIFSSDRKEVVLLRTLNDHEIDREVQVSTLFRATTLATTLMDQYMKMTATDFVRQAVQQGVQKIMELKHSCELNPALLEGATDSKNNTETLLSLLHSMLEDIFKAVDFCPVQLRYICYCLQRKARAKWPDDDTVKTRVVSSFIFLRLLGPAIVNPKSFSLVSENPSETASRTLKLVAKVIQMLANLVEPGPKEQFMEAVHPFIRKNRERMIAYLDELSCISELRTGMSAMSPGDIARELAVIHQLCVYHMGELRDQSDRQPSLRRLIAVTEVLTNHKKQYLGDT